jgi:hypothetical protein
MRAVRSVAAALIGAVVLGLALDARASSIDDGVGTICTPLDPFAVKTLREGVKHEYRPSFPGCSLAVDVAACASSIAPTEVVYTLGYGHSFGVALTITSLRRVADGVELTRLELVRGGSTNAKYGGERSDSIRVLRGTVSGAKIEEAMALAEVAHAITLREIEPTGLLVGGGWMSSSDVAASVTLVAPGSVVDRAFAGYSSSDSQLASLPLTIPIQRLDAAIPEASLASSTFDASARALFVAELSRRAPMFDEQFHWWVREAFVRAAGDGGDLSLVPVLRRCLAKSDPSSGERTRIAAISSLAVLTGVDLRFDASGAERPVHTVALEYAKMLGGK